MIPELVFTISGIPMIRRECVADAGGGPDQQPGVYGDGRTGLDAEGPVRVAASRNRTLGQKYQADKQAVLTMEVLHARCLVSLYIF